MSHQMTAAALCWLLVTVGIADLVRWMLRNV
jgi:hypothetical protein